MEKISKRASAIEEVNNNVKLLTEMVMNHSQGGAAARSSEDLMKVRPPPLAPHPHPSVKSSKRKIRSSSFAAKSTSWTNSSWG